MPHVVVSSSKGDNFIIHDVEKIVSNDKILTIHSRPFGELHVDRIHRDCDIFLAEVSEDDLRDYTGRVGHNKDL